MSLSRVTDWLWQQPVIPPPADLAAMIEADEALHARYHDEAQRLRAWDADAPYPPLPTRDDLAHAARHAYDSRWLIPGTKRGL